MLNVTSLNQQINILNTNYSKDTNGILLWFNMNVDKDKFQRIFYKNMYIVVVLVIKLIPKLKNRREQIEDSLSRRIEFLLIRFTEIS